MYQKADPASIKKIRRKCATVAPISPLRPPGEPSPTRQRGKNPKKYGANAPQLHPISYLSRTNPGKTKKYGANAPQLHAIRCSIDFCVMLCNETAFNPVQTWLSGFAAMCREQASNWPALPGSALDR